MFIDVLPSRIITVEILRAAETIESLVYRIFNRIMWSRPNKKAMQGARTRSLSAAFYYPYCK